MEDIPDDMKEMADEYREKLIEAVADHDESIMEKYFAGEEISKDEIIKVLRKGTIAGSIIRCAAAARTGTKGVQPLLDKS